MVSVINQYGAQQIQPQQWNQQNWGEYQEILRRLAALDAKLGQPDCDTPDKLEWQKAIEERLSRLEASSGSVSTNGGAGNAGL